LELDGYLLFVSFFLLVMKIVLAVLAFIGFGIEVITTILSGLEYWPEDNAPDEEHIMHMITYLGILAGCAAGIFVAIAVCLGVKQGQTPQ
tara:strand:- start:37 stop:306 length:270 start_codon:yes stop_codon:yes gene_type:complete